MNMIFNLIVFSSPKRMILTAGAAKGLTHWCLNFTSEWKTTRCLSLPEQTPGRITLVFLLFPGMVAPLVVHRAHPCETGARQVVLQLARESWSPLPSILHPSSSPDSGRPRRLTCSWGTRSSETATWELTLSTRAPKPRPKPRKPVKAPRRDSPNPTHSHKTKFPMTTWYPTVNPQKERPRGPPKEVRWRPWPLHRGRGTAGEETEDRTEIQLQESEGQCDRQKWFVGCVGSMEGVRNLRFRFNLKWCRLFFMCKGQYFELICYDLLSYINDLHIEGIL